MSLLGTPNDMMFVISSFLCSGSLLSLYHSCRSIRDQLLTRESYFLHLMISHLPSDSNIMKRKYEIADIATRSDPRMRTLSRICTLLQHEEAGVKGCERCGNPDAKRIYWSYLGRLCKLCVKEISIGWHTLENEYHIPLSMMEGLIFHEHSFWNHHKGYSEMKFFLIHQVNKQIQTISHHQLQTIDDWKRYYDFLLEKEKIEKQYQKKLNSIDRQIQHTESLFTNTKRKRKKEGDFMITVFEKLDELLEERQMIVQHYQHQIDHEWNKRSSPQMKAMCEPTQLKEFTLDGM